MALSLRMPAPPSDDELLALSQRNPGLQFERSAAGELLVTPTGGEAGWREAELCAQLRNWAKVDGRGRVFGPSTGFHLPDGSLLAPDASWVRHEYWEALTPEQREGYVPLCPDAVFEIVSPTDGVSSLRAKMRSYLVNGARLGVLIDAKRRAVELFVSNRPPEVLESAQSVSLDPVLPGFILDLESIFS